MDIALVFRKQKGVLYDNLYGINDGKAVGTTIEHLFKEFLFQNYSITEIGNSSQGIDLPTLNTDIKVTSIKQPQSSCPYKSAKQKIFGLGYNLIVFVYKKIDNEMTKKCYINFKNISFIKENRTADYTTTKMLIDMKNQGANKEDIISYINDRAIPGDEIEHNRLAEMILTQELQQGYLTISNALQWRLQYSRVINLNNEVEGVYNYVE